MPPKTLAIPNELRQELPSKQEELIRIAYRLIAKKGMHRMTLQDVADAAGMSKANIVYYFKTKQDLVLMTMRWVLARVADRASAAVASAAGPEEKVRATMDAIFVDPRRNRDFYAAYAELIAHSSRNDRFSELNEAFRTIVNGHYSALVTDVCGLSAKSSVDDDAMVIRAIIDGLFLQWLGDEQWRSLHGTYKEMCTRAILDYLHGRYDITPSS